MNVLVDFVGHADLFYSMHALFEKRLGYTLYRPLLSDEWNKTNIITATMPYSNYTEEDGVRHYEIDSHNYFQHCISWQKFLDTDIDIVVTTSWENDSPMAELIGKYKPKAKFVRVIANIHEKAKICNNILLATTEPMTPGVNWLTYHAEHRDVYQYTPPQVNYKIKSFFNYMNSFPVEKENWAIYKKLLPQYTFLMHGGESEDGSIPQSELYKVMSDSMFIWHPKPHGGCGYTARQSLASGRPLIVNKAYCNQYNTLAKNYLVDGINCIDMSVRSSAEVAKLIVKWSEPEFYYKKCLTVKAFFEEKINFAKEAEAIRVWLDKL
jgi:hypothetical protein